MTPLILVAHGSRDPRSAASINALAEQVRAQAPWLDVRVTFLELSTPRLPRVLETVHAEGHQHAVLVPLLLGNAYHATVDIPATTAQAPLPVTTTPVLGPDERLETVALRRLLDAGLRDGDGIVLGAAGSSHEHANERVRTVVRRWSHRWPAEAAFASTGEPKLAEAAAMLRARGAQRLFVGSWFLAPGLLPDRIAEQARECGARMVEPLGAHPLLAELVLDRYLCAAGRDTLAA